MDKAGLECLGITNFNQEDERLVITLNPICSIIINEVSCTVKDGATSINLNPLKYMTGMAKNDVRTGIDQEMAEGNVVFLGRYPQLGPQ